MAGASTHNTQAQKRQIPQGTWPQDAVQQSLHPMATGGSSTPTQLPSLPIQSTNLQSMPKAKGTIVNIGKISLLGIAFSLILFGAFTFLGGFLLGMWAMKPATPLHSVSFEDAPTLGLIPPPATLPQNTVALPQKKEILKPFVDKAGDTTKSAISDVQLADKVPEFLAPLVRSTQSSIGQQMGNKVEERLEKKLDQLSPAQSLPSSKVSPKSQPHQLLTAQPVQGNPDTLPSPAEHSNASAQGGNELYTIQVGVYAAKDNAYALVNRLQSLNYTSQVAEGKDQDGSSLYYVHSGLYQDYDAALVAASQFASNIPGATVMKVTSTKKSAS